ncbi:hypothetical protein LCGC14_0123990 [marine sediment metagenome]|uniref:Uncharacterized protein n=1 Tax=marine sediment metagenome TaxID=412755 RepID=A0A0F9V5V1_9ZZZZ|nr:hypothetical protein [Phycisphaerae bacterium]HDZ42650.1 hypothetical protein [Phycisphaerae bacterium]
MWSYKYNQYVTLVIKLTVTRLLPFAVVWLGLCALLLYAGLFSAAWLVGGLGFLSWCAICIYYAPRFWRIFLFSDKKDDSEEGG